MATPPLPVPLIESRLLVVEGKDECKFFGALLKAMPRTGVQAMDCGGKQKLRGFVRVLPMTPRFETLQSIGIVRDADQDPAAALQSLQAALADAGLSSPACAGEFVGANPRIGVFLMPRHGQPGCLEDLCLQSVAKDPAMTCVQEYFQCLAAQDVPASREAAKARMRAFLASREPPDLALGIAAEKGLFPWQDSTFEELRTFVTQL